jgi:hypothetical protein
MKLLFALDVISHPAELTGARRSLSFSALGGGHLQPAARSTNRIRARSFIKNDLIFARRREREMRKKRTRKLNGAVYIWAPRYIMFVQC